MLQRICLGIFILFISLSAQTEELQSIRLFTENGNYVFGYNRKMKKLMNHFDSGKTEPIELIFSHGYKFLVKGIIGRGDFFNVVFDIGDNKVLRVRQTRKKIFSFSFFMLHNAPMFDSFYAYKQGYKILEKMNLPVAKSFFTETNDHEFLIQERLEIDYFYTDYVYDDLREKIPEADLKKMDEDFIKLARQTALVALILDLRDENIVYSKKRGWILLDFWDDIRVADSYEDPNLFEISDYDHIETKARNLIKDAGGAAKPILIKPGLPRHISKQAREAILDERSKYFRPRPCRVSTRKLAQKFVRNSLVGLHFLNKSK